MIRQLDAVYQQGVLRPLEPLALPENQLVRLTLEDQGLHNIGTAAGSVNFRREEFGLRQQSYHREIPEIRLLPAKDEPRSETHLALLFREMPQEESVSWFFRGILYQNARLHRLNVLPALR